ncbi:hypothetical protein NHH03_16335 [Stieleria sp. TO1_6]|uniref:hypothetical protein n=1 Tax=Stieleria tagensis TaxID=2956795 RepID=UPI00209B5752|nr:hypothetical protein [Stieleria tagensis]MCO8123319.1 hypothetical protein [Stieleria tagensis]
MTSYFIHQIDASLSEDLEQLGTKPKFWFTLRNHRTLFKADNRETGEDWAEVIAAGICELLGLPHVPYELAHDTRNDLPGVVCPNIATKPRALVLGNQLMVEFDPEYPAEDEKKYGVRQHTVSAVAKVLETLDPPPIDEYWRPEGVCSSAVDVFIGYVMLDTLIANQDRHHQNWGAIREGSRSWLAPTFDHGAGLARNEPDVKRRRRLDAGDRQRQLEAFARRAKSGFYGSTADSRTLRSHDCFAKWRQIDESAGVFWIQRLGGIERHQFAELIEQVPEARMTRSAKEFTLELLLINQRLLLSEGTGIS